MITWTEPQPVIRLTRGFRVYRNLHRRTFSIQGFVSAKRGWRVIGHGDNFLLRDVTFKVSEAGRQRVLREGRKNVHAFAHGLEIVYDVPSCFQPMQPYPIGYNPFVEDALGSEGKGSFFIDGPHLAIGSAESVWFTSSLDLYGIRRGVPPVGHPDRVLYPSTSDH